MSEAEPVPPSHQKTLEEPAKVSPARKLALAFQSVFGQPGRNARSADQTLVLNHLREVCCVNGLIFKADAQGRFDTHAAAQRDGARSMFLIIERNLDFARKVSEAQEKPKPKTKR